MFRQWNHKIRNFFHLKIQFLKGKLTVHLTIYFNIQNAFLERIDAKLVAFSISDAGFIGSYL